MAHDILYDLRSFVELLRRENQLLVIDEEVDPNLEIAEIHRRVIERKGPALLFTKVKGSSFPVVTNLFGTAKRLELAFGSRPQQFVQDLVNLTESIMPLKAKKLWDNRNLFMDGLKIGL
ncbi:MAG: UbiD family decarboxylase, partial [Desulfocapsa sp.]|nr:UbiD family decarboxylase [Desulfocapsa sp.]